MGNAHVPPPAKLVCGILAANESLLLDARAALADRFGDVDAASEVLPWTVSRYYAPEMGDSLWRQYVSLRALIGPGKLAATKQLTNELEDAWRIPRGRQVNLDPGYVTALKLVLASTKDAAHRVYLTGGIFAEVTLEYQHGSFRPLPHTYPDYAAASAVSFFNAVREAYLQQLRLA